jgi:hypothetical protein
MKTILALLALAALLVGCKTTDPENVAERPWNAQKGWEHGLPMGINQGR